MPKQENTPKSESSPKKITIPVKNDGSKDKRYTSPQIIKSDGTRDMRTNLINKK